MRLAVEWVAVRVETGRMRIEFTYTLEDLQEALVPEAHAADPRAYRQKSWVGLVGWMVAMCVFSGIWLALGPYRVRQAIASAGVHLPQDLLIELSTTTLPASLVTLAIAIILWQAWSQSRWRKESHPSPASVRTAARRARTISILIAIAIVAVFFSLVSGVSITWHPSRGDLIAIRLGPWVLTFGLFVVFAVTHRRWHARQQWFKNPGFVRPKVLELDQAGFRFSDSIAAYHFQWPMFVRARETPNLLLLVAENKQQWLIPKRAFASQTELEQTQALIQNVIPNTTFLARPIGFPLPPVPAIPAR